MHVQAVEVAELYDLAKQNATGGGGTPENHDKEGTQVTRDTNVYGIGDLCRVRYKQGIQSCSIVWSVLVEVICIYDLTYVSAGLIIYPLVRAPLAATNLLTDRRDSK